MLLSTVDWLKFNFLPLQNCHLQHELENSIGLDKVFLLSSFYSLITNGCFKLFNQFSGTIQIPCFFHNDSLTAGNYKQQSIIFNIFFRCALCLSLKALIFHKQHGISTILLSDKSFSEKDITDLLHRIPDTSAVAVTIAQTLHSDGA